MAEETERTIGIGLSNPREGLISWKSIFKGFLAGSLIIGSVINTLGLAAIILFIIGLYVVLDALFPYGEQPYPVLTVFGVVVGGIIVFVVSLVGPGNFYMISIVIVTLLVYLSKIRGFYSLRK